MLVVRVSEEVLVYDLFVTWSRLFEKHVPVWETIKVIADARLCFISRLHPLSSDFFEVQIRRYLRTISGILRAVRRIAIRARVDRYCQCRCRTHIDFV